LGNRDYKRKKNSNFPVGGGKGEKGANISRSTFSIFWGERTHDTRKKRGGEKGGKRTDLFLLEKKNS